MKHLFVEVPKGNLVPLQINVSEQKKGKVDNDKRLMFIDFKNSTSKYIK